ncbi:META domain-containing protein [Naasia lichenicola]|uniref:META domain-containing protein n=1 Tax=Naasia lichenicola TaxID=2565933 RepID=A0A4S4FQQ8_9MICO|nr:META domain-containing protein [Naasia lichenicola]THG31746.1 META domain-containing protein [Naasia lichenicola]
MTATPIARRLLTAAIAVAAAALLSACAATAGSSGSDGQSDSVGPARAQLLGRWVPTDEGASPDAFVQFDDDGTVTLSDGCNGGEGTWTLEGTTFTAETGPHTEMFCDGYVDTHTWLSTARSIGFEDGELVLADADGASIGRLTPSTEGAMPIEPGIGDGSALPVSPTAEELVGRWTPADVDLDAISVAEGSSVEFRADGTVSATDGCLVQSGTWSIDGQQLTSVVAPDTAAMGDRVCDAVQRYSWLSGTHAAVLSNGTVQIWDELGAVIGLLTPQP